jgi:WD40 repeat protein/tRNA A-37 threonylcarbamoyl transferase component Bud32
MIEITCSGCGATLEAKDRLAGKHVRCADCGARTLVPSAAEEAVTVPPAPPQEAETMPPRMAAGESDQTTIPPTAAYSGAGPAGGVLGYEILGELGRGGMGVVYQARHTKLGRLVALKMILIAEHAGPEERARFQTEAEAVARLQHPNIVQIYEVGEQDGRPFFSLEFCAGGSLEKKLGGVPLPPREAARLAETLARAMHAAHEAGVVHRDLKPANVLLAKDGTPKITDFGLAKKLGEVGQTATGAVMGTPSYMAPEQAGGKSADIGPLADVYALGAILYECLTGRPPFKAATALDTILQVVSDEPVPPRQLQSRTPRDLETICLKCLRKEPKRRYASALALAEDLRRFQAGEPIQARPVGRVERTVKWGRRNPVVAGLLAVVMLAVAGGVTGIYWKYRDTQQALREVQEQLADNSVLLAEAAWQNNDMLGARVQLERVPSDPPLRRWEWQFLRRKLEGDIFTLRGHAEPVKAVAFSPDGTRLATGGGDPNEAGLPGEVRLWDARTGKPLLVFGGQMPGVNGMAFSPDGVRLATAGTDGVIRLWDARTGDMLKTFSGHSKPVRAVTFSPDGMRLASACADGTARLWDARTGAQLRALRHKTLMVDAPVADVSFSPDGTRLATACADRTARLWDGETGAQLRALRHPAAVIGVSFSPDGARLATASSDNMARVWDARTGTELHVLRGHTDRVLGVSFSPDGTRLATAGRDYVARVWDARTGSPLLVLKGHTLWVVCVAFSPDGASLASASWDSTARVWDLRNDNSILTLKGHRGGLTGVSFSRDDGRLATIATDGTVQLRDARTGDSLLALKEPRALGPGLALSPDGSRIATTNAVDQTARVWDARTGEQVLQVGQAIDPPLKPPPGIRAPVWIPGLSFSPDGTRLAVARGWDATAELWNVKGGIRLLEVRQRPESDDKTWELAVHMHVAFSPDGKRLATAKGRGVQVWDTSTGRPLLGFKVSGDAPVSALAFSPNGARLATAAGRAAHLWNARTGDRLVEFQGHREVEGQAAGVTSLAFSPDGTRLATGGADKTARVWNTRTGNTLLELKGHAGAVTGVAFSPDGRRLATVSSDGTARLWLAWDGSDSDDADELAYRLWATRPDPDWHASEADRLAREGEWLAAAFHYRRLYDLRPEVADFSRLSLCQAGAAQDAAYRQTCAELLRRLEVGADAPAIARLQAAAAGGWPVLAAAATTAAERTALARICLLRPGAVADPTRLLALVPEMDGLSRAAALCRAGKHDEAAKLLAGRAEPAALLFLALAEHGRGQDAAARQALERAGQWLDAPIAIDAKQTNASRLRWQQRVEVEVLRAEAVALLSEAKP